MTKYSRLPAREPPLTGESLTSLVRRTALAMGYESVHRLRDLIQPADDVPYHLEQLGPGPARQALATLLGQDEERLVELTAHRYAARLVLVPKSCEPAVICDHKTLLRYFNLSAPRICSSCLAEEPAYERLAWSLRPSNVCRKHACWMLTRCPQCERAFRRDRLDIRHCGCGYNLCQAPGVAASFLVMTTAAAIDSWLDDSEPPLSDMSMAACFWWLERLTIAAARTPTWLEQAREGLEIPSQIEAQDLAMLCAAEILLEWPGRLEEFLDVFQTVDKPHASTTGVGRSFGRLLREAWHLEQLGFTAPADVLRSYLLARYSRGHLSTKVCLFRAKKHRRLVGDRHWMSQTHARRLHLRHSVIPGLVARSVLVGHVQAAGRRTVGLVSRESVELLERQLGQSISAEHAAERLGIGRHRVLDLIHADLLSGCVRTSGGWRISPKTVETLEKFYRQLLVPCSPKSNWLTARQATRVLGPQGVTFVALLKGVLDGKIRAARNPRERDYRGLLIHQADLRRHLPTIQHEGDQAHGYPLTRLARVLVPGQPLKETVLRKWINAGLLRASRTAKRWWIQHEEVARFRDTYCLAREAYELLGISRSTLARWEREGKIQAAYSRRLNTGAGASVFRRADIEGLRDTPMAA